MAVKPQFTRKKRKEKGQIRKKVLDTSLGQQHEIPRNVTKILYTFGYQTASYLSQSEAQNVSYEF